MIPVKDSLKQIDELPGEEIQFGIGDPRWVMRSNAKLYSDISTAIIREYSTNAHDAHVMAGNPDPIEVTLPTIMNPFFIVKDKGTGLDIQDFREIYTQFGTSNKRDSNATNGTLGFGSKSGVAYTTQFTVTSVKNGTKIHGVISRKPDWSIVLKIVSTVKTDEPNGTTISIPVHNVDEFVAKAHEFYKFWLPGRVLVNGVEPKHYVGDKIVDGLYFSQGWNTSYVVMGNVAYRINNPSALFRNTKMSQINFVAYVDNGDVEFTPSREDLEYTDHTKATLQKIVDDFEAQILKVAQDEIAAAKTHAEAYASWAKWTDRLGKTLFADLEFNGDKFVSDFKVIGTRYYRNSGYGRTAMAIRDWNVESVPNTVFVTDYTLTLSSRHKQMVKQYADLMGWKMTYAVFTSWSADAIDCPWIDKTQFVDYETMKEATKKAPKPRSNVNYNNPNAGRIKGSWDYVMSTGRVNQKPLPDVVDGGKMFWIDVHGEKAWDVKDILNLLKDTKSVVIIVPGNRLAKFKRENPSVEPFIAYAKSKVVKNGPSLLTDEGKRILGLARNTRRWMDVLEIDKVDDPWLKEIKTLLNNRNTHLGAYESNRTLAHAMKMWYDVKEFNDDQESDDIVDKYPLISNFPVYNFHDDVYLYMNAKYAAGKEKKSD